MPLRPYQEAALANSKRKFDDGITRQLIALPTGTGKTLVFANLLGHHGIQEKLMVLVHRRELAEQALWKLRNANPGMRIGIEMGQDEAWRADQIVIAGVQTIGTTSGAARLRRFNPNEFGAIVCDEAHHAIASTYMRVFEHFSLFAEDNKKLLLGVTATPVRSDGRGLNGAFQEIVHKMSILDAITQGWLCDLRAYRIRTNVDLDAVRAYRDGDFVESELGSAVNTPLRNSRIVRNWLELGGNRRTVVFCVTVQHARDLACAFKSEGVSADCVWGEDRERATKLDRHKRGEITVLTNCGVLTEGYDDWQIGCILLARPTKSELLFTQMIGRGTRIEEGIGNLVEARNQNREITKPDCIVIDVVDNSMKHRLVNMATLFGYEADHDFEGARVSGAGREVQCNVLTEPKLAPEVGINEMTALIEEVDLFAPKWSDGLLNRSVLQWFRRGNSFFLPLPDRDQISIQHSGIWTTSVVRQGRAFGSPAFGSFADAFAFGEKEFKSHWTPLIHLLEREERSESDSMTPIQKQLLCAANGLEGNLTLTRDQAAHLIATTYERELNARCVSRLPPEEESLLDGDQIAQPAPIEIEPQAISCTLPEPWNSNGFKESVLQWYRTDDGGYAMPLPDMGEIFIVPRDSQWRLSGEISGVKIDEQYYESLEAAFAATAVEMERTGTEVLSAINAEQSWVSNEPTPLQRSLLSNLFDAIAAQSVDDWAAARHLIESRYSYEYNPGAVGTARLTDVYTTQLMERYRIDQDGIYESLEPGEKKLSQSGDAQDLVSAAIAESRWNDACELLRGALVSIPPNWQPLQEDESRVRGAFWDQEEFLAFVTRHREEYKTPIVWIDPSYSKMWWQLAVVNGEQERVDEALQCLARGLSLEPDHPRLWIEKGFLLNRLGRHEAALECYRTAATIRDWTPEILIARALRGQGSALIELERFDNAQQAYRKSLEFDPESEVARQELQYIDRVLKERESKKLPWFLNCIKNPPADPLTKQLLALIDGLESVPGPETIGPENYAKVSEAFLNRGWDGFEKAFDAIVPRTRPDYADVKRELLREPIFNPRVHSRMARIFLKQATIDEVTTEIANEQKPDKPQ